MPKRDIVYVVGAGFSAGLGYPLTSDLLVRLWDRLSDDGALKDKLGAFITFHHPGFDSSRFTSFPNVEVILSQMLVNEELFDASRLRGGHFTKTNLRTLQRDLLLKIADWFHELAKSVVPSATEIDWLKTFRKRVNRERATIISFNWDLILDELIFGGEISDASYGFSNENIETPVLLKPHGSLNWFEEELGSHLTDSKRKLIFGDNDSEDAIYAFTEFRAPISKADRKYTPLIVPPVYLKNFDKPVFKTVWENCTTALSQAKKVFFLGYSMPQADIHAQFIMRCGFFNQERVRLVGTQQDNHDASEVTIVNPDYGAAQRIAAIVGAARCHWKPTPVTDWING